MKIFNISVMTILIFVLAYIAGTKDVLGSIKRTIVG